MTAHHRSDVLAEIFARVTVDAGGCWIWPSESGRYGSLFRLGERGAHRVAWAAANGPVPAGMLICHRCDTPACCNPDHLFAGTPKDNQQDYVSKGRTGRRGRPRAAAGEARSLRMHLRLSEPERAALVAAAAGGEVTTWVREAALRAAKRTR